MNNQLFDESVFDTVGSLWDNLYIESFDYFTEADDQNNDQQNQDNNGNNQNQDNTNNAKAKAPKKPKKQKKQDNNQQNQNNDQQQDQNNNQNNNDQQQDQNNNQNQNNNNQQQNQNTQTDNNEGIFDKIIAFFQKIINKITSFFKRNKNLPENVEIDTDLVNQTDSALEDATNQILNAINHPVKTLLQHKKFVMVCSTVIGGLVIKHKVDKAKNNAKQVLNFFTNPKKIAATFVTAKLTNAKKRGTKLLQAIKKFSKRSDTGELKDEQINEENNSTIQVLNSINDMNNQLINANIKAVNAAQNAITSNSQPPNNDTQQNQNNNQVQNNSQQNAQQNNNTQQDQNTNIQQNNAQQNNQNSQQNLNTGNNQNNNQQQNNGRPQPIVGKIKNVVNKIKGKAKGNNNPTNESVELVREFLENSDVKYLDYF